MRAEFEYVYPVVRVPVKARRFARDKYVHGYYITLPSKWAGGQVKVHLEGKSDDNLILDVRGTGTMAYVSIPVEKNWDGKAVIAELLEDKKKKS